MNKKMPEPAATAAALFGVKIVTVIAGAIGGLISLKFVSDQLTWYGRILSVLAGAAMAGYGTPVLSRWLDMGADVENAFAFFLGLTAMQIIPGLIRLSEQFQSDPLGFIRLRGKNKDHD